MSGATYAWDAEQMVQSSDSPRNISLWKTSGDRLQACHDCIGDGKRAYLIEVVEVPIGDGRIREEFKCKGCDVKFSSHYQPSLRGHAHVSVIRKWAAAWLGVDEARVEVQP